MTVITIIGAGWLGTSLAHYLNRHYTVYASRTSMERIKILNSEGLNAFVLDFRDSKNDISALLKKQNTNTVIGCFPPGFRKGEGNHYAQYWKELCQASKTAGISKIIMISSTI